MFVTYSIVGRQMPVYICTITNSNVVHQYERCSCVLKYIYIVGGSPLMHDKYVMFYGLDYMCIHIHDT